MVSFDEHAESYGSDVERSIAFINVDHAHVTRRKVAHLLRLCDSLVGAPIEQRVLDVGCGVGITDSLLVDEVGELQGIDPSAQSVERATLLNPAARYTAFDSATFPIPDASVDLAFAICVLHHVEPEDRHDFVCELRRVVRPGGVVVIFEHNPLNPVTRVAVSRCALDEDVKLSRRRQVESLFAGAGLRVEERAFIIFTRSARRAERADRLLGWCPMGAQYYVAARRPSE